MNLMPSYFSDKPVGRPPKWETPEELAALCDDYFESCWEYDEETEKWTRIKHYSITGLCVHIGAYRKMLIDYQQKPNFKDVVKRARLLVENYVEERLFEPGSHSGPIFILKNMGWKDTHHVTSNNKNLNIDSNAKDAQEAARIYSDLLKEKEDGSDE